MQIVIDIPEKTNNRIRSFLGHGYALRDEDVKVIADAIYNGRTELEAFEWCTNCKEYDQERHCCYRWTKVIRKTVEELKAYQWWIPCSERLPEELTTVLITDKDEDVFLATLIEVINGCAEWTTDGVIAWMPRPEPYKGDKHE